jgi:endoglucanase
MSQEPARMGSAGGSAWRKARTRAAALVAAVAGLLRLAAAALALLLPMHAPSFASAPVGGALAQDQVLWGLYASQFITADGRVIDNVNGGISHTESQGYGMLLAVAAGDRETFARIWEFTATHLYVRDDGLAAWKWQPDPTDATRGQIADLNNATDGDLLIAWALAEAGAAGFGDAYTQNAKAIVAALEATLYPATPFGLQMKPGVAGFSAEERNGKPVINLSYWVFPALKRLQTLAPKGFWPELTQSGEKLLVQASASFPAALPPDWLALDQAGGALTTADGFDDGFSYNAIRIPLYLAMTGPSSRRMLRASFEHWFQLEGPLRTVGANDRVFRETLNDPGYEAIRSIYLCATRGQPVPAAMRDSLDANYYPATLQLLALMAVRQSYPKCL